MMAKEVANMCGLGHSSAHILGEACERRFGCSLCIGPRTFDPAPEDVHCPSNRFTI